MKVLNRQRRFEIRPAAVASYCLEVLGTLGGDPCSMNVVFVGPRRMRALNAAYLHRDFATDVLSFPYPGEQSSGLPFLGEVVISPHAAQSYSMEQGVPMEGELHRLLVHGTLHLLGYDHEVDNGEMNRLQRRILLKMGRLARLNPLMETGTE